MVFFHRPPRVRPFERTTNPTQSQDSARAWIRTLTAVTVAGAAAAAFSAPAQAAGPDTGCLRAGISTLVAAGLMDDVARGGLPLAYAVDELGVQPRESTDVSALPSVLPLRVVLADHRAGEEGLFAYPWCE